MNGSLEQQRLALLTKIRLSRTNYKNMLTGDTEKEHRYNDVRHSLGIPNFPKSMTLKLMSDYSLLVLAATGCLIYVVVQKRTLRNEKKSLTHYADNFVNLKKVLYRAFRIGTHILKNPDHHHLTRWIGSLISQRLFK